MIEYRNFIISLTKAEETDLVLVSVEDRRTGFVVRTALPNSGKQTASIMAFAGARYSRSNLTAIELFREIKSSGKNANEKLAYIFKNYGHSSVADMALLFAYIENVPDWYHVQFFYESRIGAGQVRSTRFQNFSKSYPGRFENYTCEGTARQDLKQEYVAIYDSMTALNAEYIKIIRAQFKDIYKPGDDDSHQSALKSRTFDTARAFLPMGANTSYAYITSAREWARIICVMKSGEHKFLHYLGEQLEFLFAPPKKLAEKIGYMPEAPDLIRHTQVNNDRCNVSLGVASCLGTRLSCISRSYYKKEIKQKVELINRKIKPEFIPLLQFLLTYKPLLRIVDFKRILNSLSEDDLYKIGDLLYSRFDHHSLMGNQQDTSVYSFKVTGSYAELKDLNRHRAWGKFAPIWESENYIELLNAGYVLPLYLDNPKLKKLKINIKVALRNHYDRVYDFYRRLPANMDKRVILNILPASHRVDYYLHANPKQISYLTKLRVRPGGHINYRTLAYMISKEIAKYHPLLSGLYLGDHNKPDPMSREDFFNRG